MENNQSTAPYKLRDLIIYFLKLGTWGFGGPVALAGYMHRDLVENKKWITEEDYKEGLALAQLAPGPLAAQLGIYMGYVHYRLLGATLAGLAFVLPSFFMVVALGYVYTLWQGIPWMQAVFYGVGAAVIGIIAMSAFKLTKKSIGHNYLLMAIYLVAAVYTVWKENENVWLFLGSGVIYWLIKTPPKKMPLIRKGEVASKSLFFPLLWSTTTGVSGGKLSQLFWYFTKAGAFVFGSGLAIVPFLYGGVVKEYGWLNEQQFVDAVAVAMITPGPVVITVGFIGYLTAGLQGASVAAFATFFPCYLFTVLPAPYFRKYGRHPGIKAFVDGVTAAAIGAISGAVIVLARRSLTDFYTVIIALATIVVLWKMKKTPEPVVILIAAALGLLLKTML
ncbi:chromate transporter [Chitinophaga terrae (ex Kim and Jung 2007)]|uniref:Chromate transporter n=1 Tax=Chitinophaga terrae (ex Kim and Jung 2007) TaxID=408074 RepID=A0A1H4EHP5_9BACT|nr:chromate transporter [Chitinophaga terrae (ex Kim and Jung 2007)]GEP91665.1 chromate resistance transporter [Chitinophaga terrae (ex Kim and Jung 2007)]SEA84594.1 chromate transporter [Chitinophaga terrae (ex Kim and Jung 2007)]